MIRLFFKISQKIKVLGLLLFTMATSFCSYAQENTDDEIDNLLDELFFSEQQFLDELMESDLSYNFIYTSLSYNNQTYFSGRDSGTEQFNMIPQVSYFHSSGFNASISGVYYENYYPHWDFTSLSLGYFHTFGKNKNFQYNIGYTRYIYSDGYDSFENSFDVSFGIRNKKRTLGSTIAASYLFGSDTSYQILSNTFVNFNLYRNSNYALRFRPNINFTIAKQEYSFRRFAVISGKRIIVTRNLQVFDLLNTQINIPISFTSNSWDFELAYNLNIPNTLFEENTLPNTSFFSFTIGYLFDFK
ncbi:hypothetical protein [Polaribacter sp.]|uniref:hypothetical protein n=1 Tax=Polaribacter sp. TaxID=1920175 RepID=UPI003F6D0D4D